MDLHLRKLELFTLVAELGSLSKAAAATEMTQSLVSRYIAQLEGSWGDRLFQRTGRGVVLTDFGRRLQPEIRLLLEQAERLESAIKDVSGVPCGTVNIGLLPSMSRILVAPLYEAMRKAAPGVRLHFMEGFSGQLDEQLHEGRLDIAVINRYGTSTVRGEDVLGFADTYLVGRPGANLSKSSTIAFRRLGELPLILPGLPNGMRSILDQYARQQGIVLDVVLEIDTLSAMKEAALSSAAFTILPLHAISRELAEGKLMATKIVNPGLRRTITLSIAKHRPMTRATQLTVVRLRQLASGFLDNPMRFDDIAQAASK